jgi:hypothetical protein
LGEAAASAGLLAGILVVQSFQWKVSGPDSDFVVTSTEVAT